MKMHKVWLVLIASVFCFGPIQAKAETIPATEYCGKNSNASLKYRFMRWDCSHTEATSISALENSIKASGATLTVPTGTQLRIYESQQPHYSAWVFDGNNATRYRALYDGDSYLGVGVTTFCTVAINICVDLESFSASNIPLPLLPNLLPPAPKAPEIVR